MNIITVGAAIPRLEERIATELFAKNSTLDPVVVAAGDGKSYPVLSLLRLFYDGCNLEAFPPDADNRWRGTVNIQGHALGAARVLRIAHPNQASRQAAEIWATDPTGQATLHYFPPSGVGDTILSLARRGVTGVSTVDRRRGGVGSRHQGWTARVRDARALGLIISATRYDERRHVYRLHSRVEFRPPQGGLPIFELADLLAPHLAASVEQYLDFNAARLRRQAVNAARIADRFMARRGYVSPAVLLTPTSTPAVEGGANDV